jgi:hypothetical protein
MFTPPLACKKNTAQTNDGVFLYVLFERLKNITIHIGQVHSLKRYYTTYWQASHSASSFGSIGHTIGLSHS